MGGGGYLPPFQCIPAQRCTFQSPQDAQERFEVLQPFLSDLALRHAEVEQEIAELQEQQNSHTVESALNSPSVTGGSRPPSVSAFAC